MKNSTNLEKQRQSRKSSKFTDIWNRTKVQYTWYILEDLKIAIYLKGAQNNPINYRSNKCVR